MTGTLSPDGKWLWNGSEWIPAPPPTTEEVLQQSAPVIEATAQQYNLNPQQLSANTQNFDLNQDNTISEYEAQLSAQSMLTPPQVAYPKPMLHQPSQSNNKKFLAIGITVLLIGSIAFWLLSPSISPISSIHDNDGDGYADSDDKFDDNPTQWADSDSDGFGDNQEQGATQVDNFTNNPTQWADSDGDGFGDNQSAGATQVDNFTNNPTQWADSDGDGFGDNQSAGATQVDNFTNNPTQWADSDGDGFGDNQSAGATNSDAFIYDSSENTDSDGDGIGDNSDVFPNDASETIDSDGDGSGDNSDAFPFDASETTDSDGDGVGDNSDTCPFNYGSSYIDRIACLDSDGDGVSNLNDAFPYDASETRDSDGDGYGDNEDLKPSGNAYIKFRVNSLEADNSQSYDTFDGPDMYMKVSVDWDCNDVFDITLYSSTHNNDYYVNSNDNMQVSTDISETESQICFSIRIYDEDSASDDDLLDYVDGQGSSYTFTRTVSQSGTINLVYSSDDYKSVEIDISVYIF